MAEKSKDQMTLKELQMQELRESYGIEPEEEINTPTYTKARNAQKEKNAKIAALYDDIAEYEENLKGFEVELEIVNEHPLKDIATALREKFPNEERDYDKELSTVLEAGWTQLVEEAQSHPKEQLELIRQTEFSDVAEMLKAQYPEHAGDFEAEIRAILAKRWEILIETIKEHIKEEKYDMKIRGLKPDYVEGVYKKYHGIE
ncbi:MAG TPA: hypothetical protein VIM88_03235 [Sulfurovum sp.]|uniref:hypothetical protein n=1 Tax=Sulfurovum sp. TaxID=1969726 RepID=UPI002F922062